MKSACLFVLIIVYAYSDDWNINCPQRHETLEERFANSPFAAIIYVKDIFKTLPSLYNATASVQCVLKGGYMDENIEISEIKRVVEDTESPCHTLRAGNQYIVFMKLSKYGSYVLLDYAEEQFDPDDSKLLAELQKIDGLEPLEIGGVGRCPQVLLQSNRDEVGNMNEISDDRVPLEEGSVLNDISINDGVNNYIEKSAGIDFEMDEDLPSERSGSRIIGRGHENFPTFGIQVSCFLIFSALVFVV